MILFCKNPWTSPFPTQGLCQTNRLQIIQWYAKLPFKHCIFQKSGNLYSLHSFIYWYVAPHPKILDFTALRGQRCCKISIFRTLMWVYKFFGVLHLRSAHLPQNSSMPLPIWKLNERTMINNQPSKFIKYYVQNFETILNHSNVIQLQFCAAGANFWFDGKL